MSVNHEAVAALPVATDVVKALLRDALVGRTPYVLASDEDSRDLIAIDPASGKTILVLAQNGRLYALDPLDSTTAHDGTTCLVSNDGLRYLIDDLNVPRSVLDKDLTTPPTIPSNGDAYLIYGSPSGDWSDFSSGDVAVETSRGWEAITLPIGALIYVEDEDAFYHLDTNGDWQEGFGINALPDNSVAPRKMIGSLGWLHPVVENQTTNSPPTSPVPAKGTAYIIGSSPTGGWAGNAGKVAVYEDDEGTYEIYTPQEGWRVYDKALDADYRYSGSAWASQRGAIIDSGRVFAAAPTTTLAGSGTYTLSSTVAPTSSQQHRKIDTTVTFQAASGLRVEIDVHVYCTNAGGTVVALFRDSEAAPVYSAVEMVNHFGKSIEADRSYVFSFRFKTTDALSHVYQFRTVAVSGGVFINSPANFAMEYRVYA